MTEPRYRRRKEDRPQEITTAAFEAFAENGYAATRIADVAKRAGISKGLLYLYFKTKEELFKAVIKSVVVRRIDALVTTVEASDLSAEEFFRGPFLDTVRKIPGSPVAIVIRLLIAEGPRYPELAEYYYDNVISKAMAAIRSIIARGVERGEFNSRARGVQPHLFAAPVMMSVIWRLVFPGRPIDTDKLIEAQLNLLLAHLKA